MRLSSSLALLPADKGPAKGIYFVHLWGAAAHQTHHAAEMIMRDRNVSLAIAASLAIWLSPFQAGASSQYGEGAPRFSIFPQVIESGGPKDPFRILLTMAGQGPSHALGKATVTIGKGLEWVEGDRVHAGHPSDFWKGPRDNQWSVRVRASEPGSTAVRVLMSVQVGPNQVDEVVMNLPVVITAHGVTFAIPRPVRMETVRNGQRFRYGGLYLVPIDVPEEVTSADIKDGPTVIEQQPLKCSQCPSELKEVAFVVFVGRDGRLLSSRMLELGGEAKISAETAKGAEEALQHWKFSPARTKKSRAVAHWTFVRVPVEHE
jgi:hypothetical protein